MMKPAKNKYFAVIKMMDRMNIQYWWRKGYAHRISVGNAAWKIKHEIG
jgi:hypothetical protein